ncbi:hypothetical protein [Hyphomonas sp.]|nr:hypothetical protein [Hyphomonas sp.]
MRISRQAARRALAEWARGEHPHTVEAVLTAIRGGHTGDLARVFG